MIRKYLALAVATIAAGACAIDVSTQPGTTGGSTSVTDPSLPSVRRAVVVSVDGLRGDALWQMPAMSALRTRAVWTDSMQTIVPSLTAPGHLAMFTGRDVTRFGIVDNTLDENTGFALAVNRATAMFQWVHDAQGTSAALVGTSLVPADQVSNAKKFFGIDELISVDADLSPIGAQAIAAATRADAPSLLFVHVPTVDFAGHDFGWIRADTTAAGGHDVLGPQYLDAVRRVDATLAELWRALEPAVARGEVLFLVTADHGGGHGAGCVANVAANHEHCTASAEDRTIPFLLIADGLTPGRIAGQPSITQVAPTVGALMRLTVPSAAGAALPMSAAKN
ncbi:MAG TPA: alkaline phosphatase family protein [Gemmatimonadaceae bacterium]|nr:alkaline phosphatase family protein [Gemmatimonadaceae bacterium]